MLKPLRGVIVPMVTPLTEAGRIDVPAVDRLVEHLIGGGVDGIFVLGTTGEALSVPQGEAETLVTATVAAAHGRVPVLAGISANCLADSLSRADSFARLGASAVVAHPPFYYPLTESEIEAWFLALADASPVPLLLYNIPQTTHQEIPLAVVARLSEHKSIIGIKDSSPDAERIAQLLETALSRPDFPVLIGSAPRYLQGLELGADGLVPGIGNLDPALCVALCDAPVETRPELHQRLLALGATYQSGRTLGQSLVALKELLSQRGLCGPDVLPPLRRERC